MVPFSDPASSVISSHTGSVCTRGNNPAQCQKSVVQCDGKADSGVGESGIDDVADDTLRVVDGRSP